MTEEKRLSIQDILEDTGETWEGSPVFRFKSSHTGLIVCCGETHIVEIEYEEGYELAISILEEKGDSADAVHQHTIDLEEGEAVELEEDDL
jgi:hypothetical protein